MGDAGFHADDRVGEHHEVRTTAGVLDGIRRVGIAIVEMRASRGSEMASGRKSHNADAVGIDGVFGGMRAHIANGALGIEQRNRMVIARAVAIGEDKGCHSAIVEPLGDFSPFIIDCKS